MGRTTFIRSELVLENTVALFAVLDLTLRALAVVESIVKAISVILASKRNTVVTVGALALNAVDLAGLVARELMVSALITAFGDANLRLFAAELVVNVAALRVTADVIFVNSGALGINSASVREATSNTIAIIRALAVQSVLER